MKQLNDETQDEYKFRFYKELYKCNKRFKRMNPVKQQKFIDDIKFSLTKNEMQVLNSIGEIMRNREVKDMENLK